MEQSSCTSLLETDERSENVAVRPPDRLLVVFECGLLKSGGFNLFCGPPGEGVVPEQEDEVEEGERRPAGGSSSGEGTGECEKGDAAAVGVLWHRSSAPLDGLLSQ